MKVIIEVLAPVEPGVYGCISLDIMDDIPLCYCSDSCVPLLYVIRSAIKDKLSIHEGSFG